MVRRVSAAQVHALSRELADHGKLDNQELDIHLSVVERPEGGSLLKAEQTHLLPVHFTNKGGVVYMGGFPD